MLLLDKRSLQSELQKNPWWRIKGWYEGNSGEKGSQYPFCGNYDKPLATLSTRQTISHGRSRLIFVPFLRSSGYF